MVLKSLSNSTNRMESRKNEHKYGQTERQKLYIPGHKCQRYNNYKRYERSFESKEITQDTNIPEWESVHEHMGHELGASHKPDDLVIWALSEPIIFLLAKEFYWTPVYDIELEHDKTNKMTCTPTYCCMGSLGPKPSPGVQQRLSSDWADA